MKAASIKEIRDDLKHRSPSDLMELCLRLARFKKENKELLTYLLFESENEERYIATVKQTIDLAFDDVDFEKSYFAKKRVRKILKDTKKFIRYSGKIETEAELLLYFCEQLRELGGVNGRNTTLRNLYLRQLDLIEKRISKLHEDLQYDYTRQLKRLVLR